MGIPLPRRFSVRFFLAFVILVVGVAGGGGWALLDAARLAMERDLDAKLAGLASLTAATLDARLTAGLEGGGEDSITRRTLRARLEGYRAAAGAKRIYLFNAQGESWVDTEAVPAGTAYGNLAMMQSALRDLRAGRTSSSLLYENEGVYYKTGFSPVVFQGRVIGGAAVEASALYLAEMDRFQRRFLTILAVALLLSLGVAALLALSVSRPLRVLIRHTEQLREGRLIEPVAFRSGTEIDALAESLERMRVEVLKRDQNLKNMMAQIAHEIKNPLGVFQLYLAALADGQADPDQRQSHLEVLRNEVRNLNTLIDEFIGFVRRKAPALEPVELDALLRELEALFAIEIGGKSVAFRWSIEGGRCVTADRIYLWQVLFNLMKNALEAVPRGGSVAAEGVVGSGGWRLRFSDSGPGIAEADLPFVFDPFFTTKTQGTGLGLAVVRENTEAMGGRVEVETPPGGGTAFTLTFPGRSSV